MKMRAQHAAVSAQNYMISTTLQLEPSHAIMATEIDSPAVQKLNQYQGRIFIVCVRVAVMQIPMSL